MLIQELKANKIVPFEVDDIKPFKIFSFFLHLAPTIESTSATKIMNVFYVIYIIL